MTASASRLSEFGLIRRYFSRPVPPGVLGGGDDCAILPSMPGALAVSTDLLLSGRHFFPDVHPRRLGHKALAVNLSDLAAMGAQPRGCVLGLAVPQVDEAWLAGFSQGWYELADRYHCPLIGGDTTRSLQGITLSVTVLGELTTAGPLRRDAAQLNDDIWVSGSLGAAHVALRLALLHRGAAASPGPRCDPLSQWLHSLSPAQRTQWWRQTRDALELPEPRVALGLALAPLARAALDVSDGLLQDLGHILQASGVAAELQVADLPLGCLAGLPPPAAWQAALGGGDDYELCFTAAPAQRGAILAAAAAVQVPVQRIGRVVAGSAQVQVFTPQGQLWQAPSGGFDHFAAAT